MAKKILQKWLQIVFPLSLQISTQMREVPFLWGFIQKTGREVAV
jgi:hypothetical protein